MRMRVWVVVGWCVLACWRDGVAVRRCVAALACRCCSALACLCVCLCMCVGLCMIVCLRVSTRM